MGKHQPPPPAAPDYAAANVAGVNADIATLPLRNAINSASTLGTSYTDPDTGKTYDFTGLGSQDVAHAQLLQQLQDAPASAAALLQLQQQYGPAFAEQARQSLQATDPTGFAMRDQLGNRLAGGGNSIESLYGTPGTPGMAAPQYETAAGSGPNLQQLGGGPSFQTLSNAPGTQLVDLASNPNFTNLASASINQRVGNTPQLSGVNGVTLSDGPSQAAGRSQLEQQIFDELSKAGTPDAALQRSAEQAARARGASTGNILGDSSALQEALGVQTAQRQLDAQRRNNALELLSSGQGTGDTANRLALAQQQSDISRAGFNNTASNQAFQNLLAGLGFNNAANTSDLANQQTVAGFNNSNSQQGLSNKLAIAAANNQANNQDFQNKAAAANFNNAAAQQGYANQGAQVSQNNDAATQAFNNAMAAINQRNQVAQNVFGAQQSQVAAKAGARQQDLANIQSFLGLQPIVSQGAQLSGLQQGAAPFMPGSGYQAQGVNETAGQQGAAFAGNIFGTQANIYGTQSQNAASGGILGTLGKVAGIAGGLGSAYKSFCHVAREVYGEDNPAWVVFYCWKENAGPRWFKALYNRFSKPVASLIRPFPSVKAAIRRWMDSKTLVNAL